MNWYYVDAAGQQAGPVDDAGLDALATSGAINTETFVWKEGMANWQPYREARPAGVGVAAAPAVAGGAHAPVFTSDAEQAVCAECGNIFPMTDTIRIGSSRVCAKCKPIFVQKMREGVNVETAGGAFRYAGFWIRFAAVFLDGLILGAFNVGLNMAVMGTTGAFGNRTGAANVSFAMNILVFCIELAVGLCYESVMVSKYGATLGKMACKIQVMVADGGKVSFARAVGRYFAKQLSALVCAIGYIMAGFDAEKRSLHDRICNTRVVYK
ncbi:MAG: domain containing protein [Pedosphaera sp.]|nr:domain containing protein [Pedosphaera sp.]